MLSGMLGISKAVMDADAKFMDDFKRAVLLEGGYVKSLGDEVSLNMLASCLVIWS
jgi:hypothetical protein